MALSRAFDTVVPHSFQTTYQPLPQRTRLQSTKSPRKIDRDHRQSARLVRTVPMVKKGSAMLLRVVFLTVILLV